jgi:hypothetical protein
MPHSSPLIGIGQNVASAGSCFAANIVPHLEEAGFHYVRTENRPAAFGDTASDNFNYGRFSAAYGNIYTARQALQLLQRAQGKFKPTEDRWCDGKELIVDPFRPGLKFQASSNREFDLLNEQHLNNVLRAVRKADVFIFTLGLTEAWTSKIDGALFPACPGTVAGRYDPARHGFVNFSAHEVITDLSAFVDALREIQRDLRIILTVSPVPLVATATTAHVLTATTYSKSVLRVAAQEVSQSKADVLYFPAYEIVTGPQAPWDYFDPDRRQPSAQAISTVMRSFLACCVPGIGLKRERTIDPGTDDSGRVMAGSESKVPQDSVRTLSELVTQVQCEEEATGL